MIRIVDYGVGNIQAFLNVYKSLGVLAARATCTQDLYDADRLILPGVGSFDHAMRLLNASGMRDTLNQMVLEQKIPILGICVGMQMLADRSDEGKLPGMGWISGSVRHFSAMRQINRMPLPHMGWNILSPKQNQPLFKDLPDRPRFYFLHSYFFDPLDAQAVVATANYGSDYPVVVRKENIYGVQCHPEKSHRAGMLLLRNFVEIH